MNGDDVKSESVQNDNQVPIEKHLPINSTNKTKTSRTIGRKQNERHMKIDWSAHQKWLAKNALHRKTKNQPENPRGKFNQNKAITKNDLEAFFCRNFVPQKNYMIVGEPAQSQKKTITVKEFQRWYESRKVVPPIKKIEPKRTVKPINQLLKRINKISQPRKYIIKAPKSLKIKPQALKYKAGKAYARLATPKPDFTPKIEPVVINRITAEAKQRLKELSKPIKKQGFDENIYEIKRWPFNSNSKIRSRNEIGKFEMKSERSENTTPRKLEVSNRKSDLNVFVLFLKDSNGEMKHEKELKPEKINCSGQCRFEELAKPSKPVTIPFKDRKSPNVGIPDRVLNYQISERIMEISKPRPPVTVPYEVMKAEKDKKSIQHIEERKRQISMQRQDRIRQKDEENRRMKWEAEQQKLKKDADKQRDRKQNQFVKKRKTMFKPQVYTRNQLYEDKENTNTNKKHINKRSVPKSPSSLISFSPKSKQSSLENRSNNNFSKITNANISKSISKNKLPEKVKSKTDFRLDSESKSEAKQFIERTRNPLQKVTITMD